jgi:sugar phosphate isomerase/epimerase
MVADLGLKIVAFQPFRDFEGMSEPQRSKVFARAERKFDVMQELGTDLLLVCSNVSPDALGGIDRAATDFRELGERAQKRGLRVAFEALAWGRHVNDYRDAWEVVRRADYPAVGLVLDSFHTLARGTDITAMGAIPRDRIFLVQIADAPRLEMDYLSWSRHYRCFPGQGELPVAAFMEALQATGYDGLLSHEIFSDRFRAGSARSVAIDGQQPEPIKLQDAFARAPSLPQELRLEREVDDLGHPQVRAQELGRERHPGMRVHADRGSVDEPVGLRHRIRQVASGLGAPGSKVVGKISRYALGPRRVDVEDRQFLHAEHQRRVRHRGVRASGAERAGVVGELGG